jgi:type II secretory pathway predicted ATPase ExeA/cell division septation protein DedD
VSTDPDLTLPDDPPDDSGCLTYETYFGLREKPFSLSPNPRFFFRDPSRTAAFNDLLGGIRRREGILALTGEVGTGKTTLCRAVLQALDRKTFAAFVPDPILSREDLLKTLLVDFGVVSVDEIRGGHLRGASRTELSYPLYEFLTSLQPLHAFAVVMIDEAQNVPNALLEEIRILSDLENEQKLLQLVLVGQPELQARLSSPEMRQLTQRLSVRCELGPFLRSEVGDYIAHRLTVAGSGGVSFTEPAVNLINNASGGIPRVINLLCDRALFRAARAGTSLVAHDHVLGAADDLKIRQNRFDSLLADKVEIQQPDFQAEELPRRFSQPEYRPLSGLARGASPRSVRPAAEPATRTEPAPVPVDVEDFDDEEPLPSTSSLTAVISEEMEPARRIDLLDTDDRAVFGEDVPLIKRNVWIAAASLALIVVLGSFWFFRARTPATPATELSMQPGQTTSLASPASPESTNKPAAVSAATPPAATSTVPSATPKPPALQSRFLIQMATFQSATRAAESARLFQTTGHTAVSVEVPLRDGKRAYAVFLGPYADRAQAERELQRAQMTPGYSGRIVEVGGAAFADGKDVSETDAKQN